MKFNWNVLGLGGGALIGQGSYFIASASLISRNEIDAQAHLAIIFSFTTLTLWITDLSTTTILARKLALNPHAEESLIRSAITARLFCFLLTTPAIVIALKISYGALTISSTALLVIQSFVWCFNLTGYYDAKQKNSTIGWISSLNWLFASILAISLTSPGENLDFIYMGFSIGTVCSVAMQHLMRKDRNPSDSEVIEKISTKEMLQLSAGAITAQAYPRAVLLLLFNLVSPKAAGIISFIKTAINGVGLGISILRRHDIIDLIQSSNTEPFRRRSVQEVLMLQKQTIFLGVFGYLIAAAAVLALGKNGIFDSLNTVIFLFLTAVYWLISSALLQQLIASGKYDLYAKIIIASSAVNIATFSLSLNTVGEFAIVLGEIAMCSTQILAYTRCRK